jgi:hypothetical protein
VASEEKNKMKELNEQSLDRKATALTPGQSCAANDAALPEVLAAGGAGPKLPRPAASAAKRKSGPAAKRRGRLEREVLAKLGKGLKDCFADVQNQEVPERFKILLQQF